MTVLFPQEGESWTMLLQRVRATPGDILLIITGLDRELSENEDLRRRVLDECRAMSSRVRLATRQRTLAKAARAKGIRVIEQTRQLRKLLNDHPSLAEALRRFSPHLWRQHLQSQLQSMGLLSLPKLRIVALATLSGGLFLFVVFRLLPSADVRITPRGDAVSKTVNIFLVLSGAQVDLSHRVRTMPLHPIVATHRRAVTYDQVSKEFIGTRAHLNLTIVNHSTDPYSFRGTTRFTNQAGMVFRITEPANVPPGAEVTVRAEAEDTDLYDQIIGARGNVPEGLKWDIPGIGADERVLVYGENREPGKDGTTEYRTVLRQQDLTTAKKRLEQELLAIARQLIEEQRTLLNSDTRNARWELLNYPELTHSAYTGFVLPTQFIGEAVTSIPVEGGLVYTMYAYDAGVILDVLRKELLAHVREGKKLLADTLTADHLVVHVIDYADDLSWVKLTVDLSGIEQFDLDPLTPAGARFDVNLREKIVGLPWDEAIRIVKNMPEVEDVQVSLWPPWHTRLPDLPPHITITLLNHEGTFSAEEP